MWSVKVESGLGATEVVLKLRDAQEIIGFLNDPYQQTAPWIGRIARWIELLEEAEDIEEKWASLRSVVEREFGRLFEWGAHGGSRSSSVMANAQKDVEIEAQFEVFTILSRKLELVFTVKQL